MQGVEIDVKDEDLVEQIEKLREVARAAAEEGDGLVLIGHQGTYPTHVPDVVLVHGAVDGLASVGVALVGELPVAVDGLVPAPSQLSADRGLSRARQAVDQIVAPTHAGSINPVPRCGNVRSSQHTDDTCGLDSTATERTEQPNCGVRGGTWTPTPITTSWAL